MAKQSKSNQPQKNPATAADPPSEALSLSEIPDESIRRDRNNEVISEAAYQHLRAGTDYFKQQKLPQAESEIIKAIELHPALSPLYNVFGLLKIARRALSTLKQSVYNALTTDPEFMDEFVKQGIEYLAQERYPEAEEQFQKAIALNPGNTDALFRLGFTQVSQKKYREAIEIFEELILMDPQNINAFFMLGIAYSEVREYYPCISNLQHALRLQPAFVEARLTLADAYHHQGKYLISLRELEALEQFIPDEDTTYLHRGMILMEMEQYEEAVPYFEKVIELRPNVAEAYDLLVGLYENLGNFARGIELAQQSLQIQPNNPEMQAALQRLEARLSNPGQPDGTTLSSEA
ncbi:MAG: tetratricopeptide repeat protein [Candidatus Sericytochromatia bacterium]|nr:tetratricopeptide repeat protein [Candidatus Sericytochromatia bacterium]